MHIQINDIREIYKNLSSETSSMEQKRGMKKLLKRIERIKNDTKIFILTDSDKNIINAFTDIRKCMSFLHTMEYRPGDMILTGCFDNEIKTFGIYGYDNKRKGFFKKKSNQKP